MNSVAVDIVTALRRPVMPGFHAAWSFGGLAGAYRRPARAASVPAAAPPAGRAGSGCCQRAGRAGAADPVTASCTTSNPTPEPNCRTERGPRVPARSGHLARGAADAGACVGLFGLIALCAAYDEGAIWRLGRAAPAAGPRRGRGPGRRGLRRLRAGRGERAAVGYGAARAARPHPGADPGRPDRVRGHAPGQPRP